MQIALEGIVEYYREEVKMDKKALFKAFKIAIDREYEARKFYSDIAEQVDDEKLKKLFRTFAAEESGHLEKLESIYSAMKEK